MESATLAIEKLGIQVFKKIFGSICFFIPSKPIRDICYVIVDMGMTDYLWDMLLNVSPEAVCDAIGFCANGLSSQIDLDIWVGEGANCALCQSFLPAVRTTVQGMMLPEQEIADLCTENPMFSPLCDTTIVPLLEMLLDPAMDDEAMCKTLYAC